jgi:hypothetical protein
VEVSGARLEENNAAIGNERREDWQQFPFSKRNVKEISGEVVATTSREFPELSQRRNYSELPRAQTKIELLPAVSEAENTMCSMIGSKPSFSVELAGPSGVSLIFN